MKKIKNIFVEYFWLFIIGSVAGCFYEMILEFFRHGTFGMHKGLLYGPFCQVYGIGLVVVVFIFKHVKNHKILFSGGFVAGGVIEYVLSYLQEVIFHSKSWDYSNYPLNLNGRTSVFHMFFWALFVWLIMIYIYPKLQILLKWFQSKLGSWITLICFLLLLIDVILSIAATLRYRNRNEGIVAANHIEVFLDTKYPNERIEAIYRMSIPIK